MLQAIVDLQLHEQHALAHVQCLLELVEGGMDVLHDAGLLVGQLVNDFRDELESRVNFREPRGQSLEIIVEQDIPFCKQIFFSPRVHKASDKHSFYKMGLGRFVFISVCLQSPRFNYWSYKDLKLSDKTLWLGNYFFGHCCVHCRIFPLLHTGVTPKMSPDLAKCPLESIIA